MAYHGRVIVYGGKGALGSACVKYFKAQNYWVGNIDLAVNDEADANIVIKHVDTWTGQEEEVKKNVASALGENKLDALFCVAGGWAGGNAASEDLVKNSDAMWKQSVWSSVISAGLAAKYLKEGGVLSLPGACPAVEGTPGMIGYGLAKAAVHQLVKSLAAADSGLPKDSYVAATLPVTLDTPMNRKWMSAADFSTWTPLEFVAEMFHKWLKGEKRPANGSLVKLITKDSKTELVIV